MKKTERKKGGGLPKGISTMGEGKRLMGQQLRNTGLMSGKGGRKR